MKITKRELVNIVNEAVQKAMPLRPPVAKEKSSSSGALYNAVMTVMNDQEGGIDREDHMAMELARLGYTPQDIPELSARIGHILVNRATAESTRLANLITKSQRSRYWKK